MPETGARPTGRPAESADEGAADQGPWVVILYNCDCHSFDAVVEQLCRATGCPAAVAWRIALEAHVRGRAVAFTGPAPECERVAGVLRAIRLQVETDRF